MPTKPTPPKPATKPATKPPRKPRPDALPGNAPAEVAARMRHLWRALEFPTSAAFAAAIGASPTRWNNIENGGSLSREIAFKIVQKFPGVTTDYLWFGRMDGMPLQRVRQLEMPAGAAAKSRTRS
jgi:DNA-binding XRE family transcriptional regulator